MAEESKVEGKTMKEFVTASLVCLLALSACSNSDDNRVQGYIEGELIYLSSSQSGALKRLDVQRGDRIKVEQALFQLDAQPESDTFVQAQAQLASDQATLQDMSLGQRPEEIEETKADIQSTQAAITYYAAQKHRYEQLAKLDYAAKADYDESIYQYEINTAALKRLQAELALGYQGQRQYQLEAQQQTVKAADAGVAIAQWHSAQKTVTSSASGVVFDTYYKLGEWVPAGQPVLSLQAPENIDVIFFVSETQLGHIHLGDTIAFACDACKSPAQATIDYISSSAEYTPPVIYSEDMRSKLVYEVRASIPNALALQYHPGQPVDVALNGQF